MLEAVLSHQNAPKRQKLHHKIFYFNCTLKFFIFLAIKFDLLNSMRNTTFNYFRAIFKQD